MSYLYKHLKQTYQDEWQGTSVDKGTTYKFSLSFSQDNSTARVHYTSSNNHSNDELVLDFQYDKGTLEGVKKTIWLKNGTGKYYKKERSKESTRNLENENLIVFLLGPRCVFGIDMPPVMIHDLRLQKRVLGNLEPVDPYSS